MNTTVHDFLKNNLLLYDGSKGAYLQFQGLSGKEVPELWNVTHSDIVKEMYKQYIKAGSDIIQTNTFSANKISLHGHKLEEQSYVFCEEGVRLAKEAAGEKLVAASAGPTGKILMPLGDLSFEEAVSAYAEMATSFEKAGADFIHFETFTDLSELRAAMIGAKSVSSLPILVSFSFENNGRTLTGTPPSVCALVARALGAVAVGANCSGGPESLVKPIQEMYHAVGAPLLVKPNAGLPQKVDNKIVFSETPEDFASYCSIFVENGVRLIGGCCGTMPEHISALNKVRQGLSFENQQFASQEAIASSQMVSSLDFSSSMLAHLLVDAELFAQEDYDSIFDEVSEMDEEIVLLDFSALEDATEDMVAEFVSNYAVYIKKPTVIKTSDEKLATAFLRYYPGVLGVTADSNFNNKMQILSFYGAKEISWEETI